MNNLSLTDRELQELLVDLESDRAERKESLAGDAPNKIRQAICAFANDLPNHSRPGVVFVGVCDDGSAARLAITDDLLLQLADMKSDGNIVPPPTMAVEKRRLGDADVAVITIAPSDAPPVRTSFGASARSWRHTTRPPSTSPRGLARPATAPILWELCTRSFGTQ